MTDQYNTPAASGEATYCAVHPDRETGLRCNKCERYMCPECAVQTPVGYRCKQCVRQHEDKFFTAASTDYGIVFGVCALISAVGVFALSLVGGFLLFVIFLAIPIGGAASEVALRLTKRRRGRYSGYVAAAGVVAGVLAYSLLFFGQIVLAPTFLVYAAVVAITAYGRFQMKI